MRISDFLSKEAIIHSKEELSKEEAIRLLTQWTARSYGIPEEELLDKVMEREQKLSTGIGLGVAIPHCRFPRIDSFYVGLLICEKGVPFNAVDGLPVHIIFLIVSPEKAVADHLRIIAMVSRILSVEENRKTLRSITHEEDIMKVLRKMEEAPMVPKGKA